MISTIIMVTLKVVCFSYFSLTSLVLFFVCNFIVSKQLILHSILQTTNSSFSPQIAVVIHIPVPLQSLYHKIQGRLVRELEKKLSGKHVIFLAKRRILSKPTRHSRNLSKQKRPRSRTLTAVHEAILDDLVYPAEVII